MKDWILYNRNLFAYGFLLIIFFAGVIFINERLNKEGPEYLRVQGYCLEIAEKIEGIKLNPREAEFIPIGGGVKQVSYSGIMMVWEKEISGISVKCSVISNGNEIRYFAVNDEDKTSLARREERKE